MAIGGGDGEGYHSSGSGSSGYGGSYQYSGYNNYHQQQQYGKKGHSVGSTSSSNPFRDESSSSSSSPAKYLHHCFLLVLLLALSASTFVQYRSYSRTLSQLNSVRLHLQTHPVQSVDDDQSELLAPNEESDYQKQQASWHHQLHSLTTNQSQLKEALAHLSSHQIPRTNAELTSVSHQYSAVQRENEGHANQLEVLRDRQKELTAEIEGLKGEYAQKHHTREGDLLIPAAGSGNRIAVRRRGDDTDPMDSLEELEEYVRGREDALWKKIDVLMESMKEMAREEVEEW